MLLGKNKIRTVAFLLVITVISIILPTYNYKVKADVNGNSKQVENILKEIIKEYGRDNIIFEDGIVLEENEKLNLSKISSENSIDWISRDSDIAKIHGETIYAVSEGTTFLVGELNGKFYLREVYVSSLNNVVLFSADNVTNDNERKGQYLVYLDPGHGGEDPGAMGNGINEKDITLKLALGVKQRLEASGIKVLMSRDKDVFVSLQDISKGANDANPDAFVSIHLNSFTKPTAYGIETWHYKDMDKPLADLLQAKLIEYTEAWDRGVKKEEFHVIKATKMPASLVEAGFLSTPEEAELLKSEDYQNLLMDAIANATIEYLNNNVTLEPLAAERVFGNTRYETSYNIFNKGWESSENVILASGIDYPDALCAAPLAVKHDAPILLSRNTTLESQPDLKDSLVNKGVKNVIIVGGETAIPKVIQDEIASLGINVRRIGGKDRYETAVLIAKEVGVTNGEIALANGMSFADGLSISPIAGRKQSPILLTKKDNLPEVTMNFINENEINKTYIIGQTTVITDKVADQTKEPERLGGANRYETNATIFNRFKSEVNLSDIYVASGLAFPDALSSSALAAKNGNFVLLSNIRQVEDPVKNIINEIKPNLDKVYVLGSNIVVSDDIVLGLGVDNIK